VTVCGRWRHRPAGRSLRAQPLTAIRLPLKPREESGMECAPRPASHRHVACRHRRR
jgi:hypothetical protein